MRRIFTFILVAILNLSLFAQVNRTEAQVHLDEPGTLSAKLKEQGIIFGSINKLIVTGKFNQRDFSSMKMQMTNLQYVDISGTDITEIPSEAMRDKSQLTHFYAPASVRKIGQYAFNNCHNLQNLPFEPASIDTIRDAAFEYCYLMKGDLIFSEKLSYLGSSAFSHSGIEHVDLSKSILLSSLDAFRYCTTLKTISLSPSINSFNWGAFNSCSSLQEIDLSVCENLTSLGDQSFEGCSSLRKVILPESMRQIYTPFQSCNNLREIVVKSSTAPSIQEMTFGSVNWDEAKLFVPIGSKETYEKAQHWNLFYDIFEIGLMVKHNPGGFVKQNGEAVPNNKIVFHDAKETIFEFIPQDGYEVRSIRFKGQEQTPSNQFTVPAGTENAVVDVEFALKKFDVDVTISGQGSVKWEGAEVLTGTSVAIDSSAMARFIIRPAKGYILNELTFNGEVNIVQQDSVYVTPMIQHASVLNIQFASEAEVGAAHKLHFTIGENGRVDYMNTPLLPATTISVKEGEPAVFTFYPAATYRLAKVMLDTEDVTAQVENNQLTLSNVTKESNVTVSFEVDPVSALHVQTRGTLSQILGKHQYAVVTDLTLSGELNEQDIRLLRDSVKHLTNLDLSKAQLFTYSESGVLYDNAFDGKVTLKSIVLPVDLKEIRGYAFHNCKALDSINLTALNDLTTIGNYVFAYTGFQSLVFPEKAINWGSYVLDGVNKLTTVVLPKSIRQIPAYSFNACNSLKIVNISELTALESIGSCAFQSCLDLSALTIPAGVKQIGSNAFYGCQRLVEAHILAETPPALSDNIFGSYLALLFVPEQSVSAYKTASYWSGYNVISRDSKPVTVHVGSPGTLAASLTNQGCQLSDVFNLTITGNLNAEDFRIMNKSMPSLIEVDMSGSEVREIPANAFDGKSKLKRFVSPKGIRVIGDNAFKECQILENIPFGDSIQSIGSTAFYNCMNMTGEISFPESLSQLGSQIFQSCYKLTKVDFSKADRISSIPSSCFQSSGIRDIVWNANLQRISSQAFEYTKVEKVDLSSCVNLYSIEYNAFSGCSNLKTVILPNSNSLSISSDVFTSSSINSIVCLSSRTPSIQESTFSGVDYNRCVLYVPTGAAKTYGLTSIWATFTKIEEIGVQVLIGKNGSVLYEGNRLADKTVLFGEANSYTFKVMPEPGYVTDSLWVDYQLMDKDLTEVVIPAGIRKATVKAKFALKKFGLRIQIEGEGQVKMADRLLTNGETVALDSCSMLPLIMLPAEGFDADTIRFNEMPCVLQRDSVFMTPQLEKPSDLLIRFVAKSEMGTMHRVSTTARKNGRIEYCNTPLMTLSSVKVKEGEQAEFTFIGEKGYLIDRVWLNGKDVTAMLDGNKLLTPAVQSAIELEASYKVNPVMVVESKYPGQLEGFFNTDQKKGVSNLKLKGALNSTDFNFLRDSMEVLSVLDLREARVGEAGAYGEAYYTDEIPSNAFYNSKGKKTLTEVYLPKETKRIGSYAFREASNLSEINWSELTALESIQSWAFRESGIKELVLPESFKSFDSWAFSYSRKLEKVDLSKTQLKIIPEYQFYNCESLVEVKLPNAITEIKNYAFSSTQALNAINLEACKQLRIIGDGAFQSTAIDTLRLPASVKEIGNSAFNSNSNLKKVDLSNLVDLKVLPASIFSSCSNLTDVVLPPNVITIENDAFSGSALSGTLQLPETVTNIGDNAFNAGNLKFCKLTVTTPPVIGNNIFNSGTLIGVFVPESAVAAYESNERWGQYLILGGERRVTVHVDRGGELAQQIMYQAKVSPATVTHLTVTGTLNEADFGGIRTNMTVLYNLDLSQTDVTYLPNGAFRDKRILMNVQLPDGLQEIGANAFMNCRGLQDTLTIPGGVTRIGDNAFQNCSDLHRVELPESLRQIGSNTFDNCSRLTQEIVFPRGVREIGYQAFRYCSNLYGTIEFSESLTSLSSYAFEGCSKVERVDLSKATQLYSINDHCFNGNSALKEVIFPKELRSIYSYAFQGCSKLDNLVFPQTLQTIGSYAFANNTSLTQLDLSKSNQCYEISEYAFQNCKSLQTVNFPIALSSVGTRAFAGCDRLANISASNPNPATMYDQVFEGVKTRSCVLSIPTMSFYKYLNAEQWGQFVQMRKAIDVGVSKGGSVEYFAVSAEDPVNPSPIKVRAQDGTETDKGAILADASTIYVDEAEQIRFVINPEIANGTMKVLYNNVDVTNQMQGNVFVANQITEERGQLVVNFDIESEINIAVRAQNGGTVSGGGIAVYGEMVLVKAIPQFGYKFVKWTHNGVEVSRDAEYSFKAIQSLELEAQFVQFVSQLGDANGDNRVNISDVVTTVDYIIGKNPQAFIFEAADVNQDNRVNISDVVAIVDLILNPSGTKAASFDNGSSLATISGTNNQFIIESEKPVYGIEFAYDGEVEALDCLSGFEVTFFERDGETRVLAYSMNKGLTGKNAMFRFSPKAKVNDLIVVDKKGNEFELSGAFGNMAGSEEIEIRIENGYLKANSNYAVKRIEIYDMSGRIILNGNTNELNIQTLNRSSYVVRVVDEVRESRRKMIIGNNR